MNSLKRLVVIAGLAVAMVACGGGGSSEDTTPATSGEPRPTVDDTEMGEDDLAGLRDCQELLDTSVRSLEFMFSRASSVRSPLPAINAADMRYLASVAEGQIKDNLSQCRELLSARCEVSLDAWEEWALGRIAIVKNLADELVGLGGPRPTTAEEEEPPIVCVE